MPHQAETAADVIRGQTPDVTRCGPADCGGVECCRSAAGQVEVHLVAGPRAGAGRNCVPDLHRIGHVGSCRMDLTRRCRRDRHPGADAVHGRVRSRPPRGSSRRTGRSCSRGSTRPPANGPSCSTTRATTPPAAGRSSMRTQPGRDASCTVEQVVGTRGFIDCDGNTIDVSELSPPDAGVNPVVENQRVLIIDLSGITTG